jgi:hypothetical protein
VSFSSQRQKDPITALLNAGLDVLVRYVSRLVNKVIKPRKKRTERKS